MFILGRRGFGGLVSVFRASQVALMLKNPLASVGDTRDWGWEDPLEEGMATHSSILA